jgi:hypothetical protein
VKVTTAKKPYEPCNPPDKEGEGIFDPTAHLTCYKIKDIDPKFDHIDVPVADQFGELSLTPKKPRRLCVPSTKIDLE